VAIESEYGLGQESNKEYELTRESNKEHGFNI
jgi:hypothetical protein